MIQESVDVGHLVPDFRLKNVLGYGIDRGILKTLSPTSK